MDRRCFPNLHLLGLPNCMGLSERGKCNWLNNAVCKGENCKFMRLEADLQLTQMKLFQRLASLSEVQQAHISNKYYNGRKPWIEDLIQDKGNVRNG